MLYYIFTARVYILKVTTTVKQTKLEVIKRADTETVDSILFVARENWLQNRLKKGTKERKYFPDNSYFFIQIITLFLKNG